MSRALMPDGVSKRFVRESLFKERRELAKQAVIEAVKDVWGEDNIPEGYAMKDIFATDYHTQDWGWWFYLTTRASKEIVFKASYSYSRKTYQVAIHTRAFVSEIDSSRIDTSL